MVDDLRRLNNTGISRFSDYLVEGASTEPPVQLLYHPETSEPLDAAIKFASRAYTNRYDLGRELVMRLGSLEPVKISSDRGLWSGLALLLFDQLCPSDAYGKRKVDKDHRYILSADYRHYYRHLVRTPWQLCREHGPNARFLLLATSEGADQLRRHGDMLEQLGGTQSIIRSKPIIAEASNLYSDPISGRPKKGAAGKGGGSIRRFARVLKQLDLTFDPEFMPPGGLSNVLPEEFGSWKKKFLKVAAGSAKSVVVQESPEA